MSTVSHLGPYFPERTAIVSKSTHDAAGVKRKAADDVRTRKPKKMKSILSWGANASRPPGAPSAPPREPNHNAPASGTIMELTTSTSRDAVPPPIEFQFPHDLLKSLAKHLPSSYPSGAAPPHLITEFVFHGSFSICYFPQSSHPHARRLHMIIHELRMMGLLFSSDPELSSHTARSYACWCTKRPVLSNSGQSTVQEPQRACNGMVSLSVMDDFRNPVVTGQRIAILIWHLRS